MSWIIWLFAPVWGTGFDLTPKDPEVLRWREFLLGERMAQTRVALEQAGLYLPAFERIFREQGVPEDLLWLALIESSFRHDAVSPTGASGMFQFREATAAAFGLRVDDTADHRLEPLLAARAAARYLAYLFAKFQDWELVLAAYNLGEGDLRRAMEAARAETWIEIKPALREETQNYVGKVRAAAIIGKEFWRGRNPTPSEHTRAHQVVKGDTLFAIARRYGLNLDQLKLANGLKSDLIREGDWLVLP